MHNIPATVNASNVFQGRALAELATGRPDNAFQDVQTLLALARAAGSPPFLISLLVESSISDRASQVINDGLERHAWTDAQLANFSSELSRINLITRLSDCLRWDRTCGLQLDASRTLDMLTLQGLPDTDAGSTKPTNLRAATTADPMRIVSHIVILLSAL
jgi:hypothetical protein